MRSERAGRRESVQLAARSARARTFYAESLLQISAFKASYANEPGAEYDYIAVGGEFDERAAAGVPAHAVAGRVAMDGTRVVRPHGRVRVYSDHEHVHVGSDRHLLPDVVTDDAARACDPPNSLAVSRGPCVLPLIPTTVATPAGQIDRERGARHGHA